MRPSSTFSHPLDEIANFLGLNQALGAVSVTGITSNSKDVKPGDVFVALPGQRVHGLDFATDAIAQGAVAIISDRRDPHISVPTLVISDPRGRLGELTSWFYGDPSRQVSIYGVTGTNGKTTTTYLLFQIWRASGISAGLVGTVGMQINDQHFPALYTTPEADELQAIFATMVESGIKAIAMEVSSHALVQRRVSGTHFQAGGFTNLTQDHLDFHQTMENYYQAKRSLFNKEFTDRSFITIDDDYGKRLAGETTCSVATLSSINREGDWKYESVNRDSTGSDVVIVGPAGVRIAARFNLVGEHNLQNLLLAVVLAFDSGVKPHAIENSIPHLMGAPGRLERLDLGQPFTVLVDYAHTPDAVERALATARALSPKKVIAILGCGGDRDRSKRAIMGRILNEGSDLPIFTSDNPRSEDPQSIIDEMTSGLKLKAGAEVILDRRDAIMRAVSLANEGDVVIVLGKGHETGQEIKGVKYPFSDQKVLREVLGERI